MSASTLKIYWPRYPTRKPNAAFLGLQKEGRTEEVYQTEMYTIENLAVGYYHKISDDFSPQMYLYQGKFKDFMFNMLYNNLLFINQRVRDAFAGELDEYGVFYPIQIPDSPCPYYIYAVQREVNALDLTLMSEKDPRYQPGVPYGFFERDLLEFQTDQIYNQLVFKDAQQNLSFKYLYLSQRFVDTVKQNKLTGLHKKTFEPIWPRKK